MQEGPPLLVLRRPAKADGVVLQPIPFHEKQVRARLLQAPRQRQATEPRHAPDDRLGLRERRLEGLLLAWLDRQQRMLKDHGEMIAGAADVERLGSPNGPLWDTPAPLPVCISGANVGGRGTWAFVVAGSSTTRLIRGEPSPRPRPLPAGRRRLVPPHLVTRARAASSRPTFSTSTATTHTRPLPMASPTELISLKW